MKSRTTMTYAVALGLVSTLALAGCNGGDGEPTGGATGSKPATRSTTPPPSATATQAASSPSPSTRVTLPTAAQANTEAGARAFAQFFVTEMDRAYVEADSSFLRPLFTKNCEDCQNVVEIVDKLRASGTHQTNLSASVAGTTYAKLSGQPAVDVFVEYAGATRVDRAGKVVFTGKDRKVAYRLRLANSSGWLVDEIGTL